MNATYGIRRDVGVGMLLKQAFINLRLIWRQVLAYLAGALIVAFIAQMFGNEPGGLVGLMLYLGGQYWLFHSWAKAKGLLATARIRFFAFTGLAFLLILPILFGIVLFVIPGIFLVARWLAAPAFIVAKGEGVIEAAGSSWDAVRGHTFAVGMVIVIMFIGLSAVSGIVTGFFTALLGLGALSPANLLQAHLFPLFLLGLSTATYELLGPEDNSIEEVFG